MSISRSVVFFLIVIVLSACGTDTQPLPPPVDLQAEEQQIRELTQKWEDADNRKDIDTVMQFFASGIVFQAPGMPAIEGKEEVRNFLSTLMESMVSVAGGPMTIVVSERGDMAYLYGTSKVIMRGPEGEFEDPEKFLFVWQKIDGEWKTVAAAFSSDKVM